MKSISINEKNCTLRIRSDLFNFDIPVKHFFIANIDSGIANFVVEKDIYDVYIKNMLRSIKYMFNEFYKGSESTFPPHKFYEYIKLFNKYVAPIRLHCVILCDNYTYHLDNAFLRINNIEKTKTNVSFFIEYMFFFTKF